jgi:RNA dependent RNA polymerase
MLQAGFDPNTNPILRRKLRGYFESIVKTQVLKGRVEIPQSVRLMMIAGMPQVNIGHRQLMLKFVDPFHTLEPGECFVQFSRALTLPDGTLVTRLDGDVLVGPVC